MTENVEATPPRCWRCGADHPIVACPHVKAVEFSDAAALTVSRVEFLTPADWGVRASSGQAGGERSGYPTLNGQNKGT